MITATLIACALAAIAVALGVAAYRMRRAHLDAVEDWRAYARDSLERAERWQVETGAAHAAELDDLQLRYERERDLADGRLREIVRQRHEIDGLRHRLDGAEAFVSGGPR